MPKIAEDLSDYLVNDEYNLILQSQFLFNARFKSEPGNHRFLKTKVDIMDQDLLSEKYIKLISFLICFLSVSVQYISAQPYFSESIDLIKDENIIRDQTLWSSTSKNEGTYFYQSKQTNTNTGSIGEIGITFYKDSKMLDWQNLYSGLRLGLNGNTINDGIAETSNGVVFVANTVNDTLGQDYIYTVLFIDSLGNEMNRFSYSSDYIRKAKAITTNQEGVSYITGFEYVGEEDLKKNWTIFLSAIDTNGIELFHRNYSIREFSDQSGSKFQIEASNDGNIYLTNYSGYAINKKAWVMKLDTFGNEKWIYSTEESTKSDFTYLKLDVDESHNRIYLSWYSDYSGVITEYYDLPKNLIAIDTSGNQLWKHDFQVTYGSDLNDIDITDNGDILVCGYDRDLEDGAIFYGWLARLNEYGDVLWQKYILENDHRADETGGMSFSTVEELNDGSILLGGNIIDTVGRGDFNQNAWIVRLDSTGNCYGDDCPDIFEMNTTSVTNQNKNTNFNVFPNPADTDFKIKFSMPTNGELSLVNMNGVEVKNAPLNSSLQVKIDCHTIQSGLYSLLLSDEKGNLIASQKIIIQ